jgi:hypothetical protein
MTQNEEIENCEDDYFELQKIIETKRDYNEQLDRRIARKSYEIGRGTSLNAGMCAAGEDTASLSDRLIHFFLF